MVTLRIGVRFVLTAAGAGSADWDAVADGDLLGADEDVFDEQPQYPLAFFDGGGGGGAVQLGEEAPEVVGELEVGVAVGCLCVEGVDLPAQAGFSGAQVRHAVAQLVDGQELFGECLDHGGDRGGGPGQLNFEALPLPCDRVAGAGGVQPLADLGADQGRVGEPAGDVVLVYDGRHRDLQPLLPRLVHGPGRPRRGAALQPGDAIQPRRPAGGHGL